MSRDRNAPERARASAVARVAAAAIVIAVTVSPSGFALARNARPVDDRHPARGGGLGGHSRTLRPRSLKVADFNGDGRGDLAVGVPRESVGSIQNAGAVNVIYGAAGGLSSAGDQLWDQDSAGVPGSAADGSEFGSAVAAGDFDGDGDDDLAIGVPFQTVSGADDAGAVVVLYGAHGGLSAAGAQQWSQASSGIGGAPEAFDHFGLALASGDFDGDGFLDLAVGVPDDDIGNHVDAGAVNVLYGSANGLTSPGNQLWDQNTPNVLGTADAHDRFGSSVISADFSGDGDDDLAVGVPGDVVDDVQYAGSVNVLYGSTLGLISGGNQLWNQSSPGVPGTRAVDDDLGTAVAAGNFGMGSQADLAIGVPGDFENGSSGGTNVLYGTSTGLSATGSQLWTNVNGGGSGPTWERYGETLAAANFGRGSTLDLAIGDPEAMVGGLFDAGASVVLYSGSNGLAAAHRHVWTQNSGGIKGQSEANDDLSAGIGSGDYDGNGVADLCLGVPGESLGSKGVVGAVDVIYGTGTDGLTSSGNQLWDQDSPGIQGDAENSDSFGHAVTAGRH